MDFQAIIKALSCKVLVRSAAFDTARIQSVVASDLMSDVLTTNKENFIISTSLNSEQVIRTADIVGALGVLLVNGKHPQESMKTLAAEKKVLKKLIGITRQAVAAYKGRLEKIDEEVKAAQALGLNTEVQPLEVPFLDEPRHLLWALIPPS